MSVSVVHQVAFQGTRNTNRDGIPNGCIGTVKTIGDKNWNIGMVLVQWSGSAKGVTTWVSSSQIK